MKKYYKKKVDVEAVQLTHEMLMSGKGLPEEIEAKSGRFFLMTFEGMHHAPVGAWFVRGQDGDVWFVQEHIFKKNYAEADIDPKVQD